MPAVFPLHQLFDEAFWANLLDQCPSDAESIAQPFGAPDVHFE